MWPPQSAAFFMIATFAWLHEGSAGYPIGGSLPLAKNVERRCLELGGEVRYGACVDQILVDGGRYVSEVHRDLYERAALPLFISICRRT